MRRSTFLIDPRTIPPDSPPYKAYYSVPEYRDHLDSTLMYKWSLLYINIRNFGFKVGVQIVIIFRN